MTVITAAQCPWARVFLREQDVSDRCTAADPDMGWVELIVLRDGRPALGEDGEVLVERVYGLVRVEELDAAKIWD